VVTEVVVHNSRNRRAVIAVGDDQACPIRHAGVGGHQDGTHSVARRDPELVEAADDAGLCDGDRPALSTTLAFHGCQRSGLDRGGGTP
jgi:hypothetical protein